MLRNFLFLASLIGVTCFIEASQNVVFILADDMNRDSWGTYGNKDCKTPHIDRLANEGVKFERAYCSVAMCAPFRQELYSGRSPWRSGTFKTDGSASVSVSSIARVSLQGISRSG